MALTMHKVAGVYADRGAAREGARVLREAGFSADQVALVGRQDWETAFVQPEEAGDRSAKSALIGAGTGAGLGAAGAGALAVAEVSVIAAAPILSVLAGAGLGAMVGTAIAGIASASVRESDFKNLVREAVEKGHFVVIARAHSESDALEAQSLIARTAEKSLDQFGSVAS